MKVLLAIPTLNSIHYRLVPHIVRMCEQGAELYISSMIGNEANRNAIANHFLSGDWDYLLMIDSDQEPVGNPLDLIKCDKDVVSAPTVVSMANGINGLVWNVYDVVGGNGSMVEARKQRGTGLEEVYAVGTGCILIKRKVLETIKNAFVPIRNNEDRRIVTQDIAFCIRCSEEGFGVWANWDIITRHYKEIDLLSL